MVTGYVVNRKTEEGKFEKVSKLFANADGSFGNKKDGIELKLNGKYPDLLVNGKQYGKTFLNQSKATGKNYYLAKNAEGAYGDLFIFEDVAKPKSGNAKVSPVRK